MKMLTIMLILGLAGLGFSVLSVTGTTPMNCLKQCCATACGNGQWDSDGGFCHGPQANTTACLSCQSDCRGGVQPTTTEPTQTVSVVNNSVVTQNVTTSQANSTGNTQSVQPTNSQPTTANASSQSFNLSGLWMVLAAILIIIVLAILILGLKH